MIDLETIVSHFSEALQLVDADAPQGSSPKRIYQPGVGPLTESEAIASSLTILQVKYPDIYASASPFRYPETKYLECFSHAITPWGVGVSKGRPPVRLFTILSGHQPRIALAHWRKERLRRYKNFWERTNRSEPVALNLLPFY